MCGFEGALFTLTYLWVPHFDTGSYAHNTYGPPPQNKKKANIKGNM